MKPPHNDIATVGQLEKLAIIGYDFRDWYNVAALEITRVCGIENWNTIEFSRKLAILSPQVSVRRNVRLAITYFGQGKLQHNVTKSIRRSLEIYEQTGKIGGQKVSAFAANLLGNPYAVTLDTWMGKALFPDYFGNENPARFFRRKATRCECMQRVWQVGQRLGLSARDAQACIWAGVFREHGGTPQRLPVFDEYTRWVAYGRSFPLAGAIPDEPETILVDADETF